MYRITSGRYAAIDKDSYSEALCDLVTKMLSLEPEVAGGRGRGQAATAMTLVFVRALNMLLCCDLHPAEASERLDCPQVAVVSCARARVGYKGTPPQHKCGRFRAWVKISPPHPPFLRSNAYRPTGLHHPALILPVRSRPHASLLQSRAPYTYGKDRQCPLTAPRSSFLTRKLCKLQFTRRL